MNDKRNVLLLLYLLDRHIYLQITAVARRLLIFGAKYLRLCWKDFLGFFGGGGGRGWRRCFKHFLECTYFSRLAKVIIRILQPLLCFFLSLGFNPFFHLLNFYLLTRFLNTPLLATCYCFTLFSNTPAKIRFHKQQLSKYFSRKNSSRVNIIRYQCWVRTGYFLKIAKLVRRVSCILYLPRIYLHRIWQFALRCFSSFKLYTLYFSVVFEKNIVRPVLNFVYYCRAKLARLWFDYGFCVFWANRKTDHKSIKSTFRVRFNTKIQISVWNRIYRLRAVSLFLHI